MQREENVHDYTLKSIQKNTVGVHWTSSVPADHMYRLCSQVKGPFLDITYEHAQEKNYSS